MSDILAPSLTLGARNPWVTGDRAYAERIRMVLETRPGTLPWRPEFGCDLDGLLGQPATPQRLGEVKWKVEQALRRWVPQIRINRCAVSLVRLDEGGTIERGPTIPIAEAALLSLGTQAALEVGLDVETPEGPLSVQATIEP